MPTSQFDSDFLRQLKSLSSTERTRILAEVERNAKQRRKREDEESQRRYERQQVLDAHRCKIEIEEEKKAKMGVLVGGVVALAGFTAAYFIASHGKEVGWAIAGAGLGGATLVAMAKVFLDGTATRRLELQTRQDEAEALRVQSEALQANAENRLEELRVLTSRVTQPAALEASSRVTE